MRYHNITKDDMLNGDGLRVVLWVAGCNHCCKECHNPITWDPDGGLLFDEDAKQEIFEQLNQSYISGITFSGGDPLFQVEEATELAKRIKHIGKNIWCYTGYTYEQILADSRLSQILPFIDVLVDGRFDINLRDISLRFRGSANQRLIDVHKSQLGKIAIWED